MTRSYFRRADGVMLLYDVTNERSFLSVRQWIDAVDVSNRQTDKQTDRQTDRQTDKQTDRQTDRQINKQTDRQTDR